MDNKPNPELIAVLTAAISSISGVSIDKLIVRSVKKVKVWNDTVRINQINQ